MRYRGRGGRGRPPPRNAVLIGSSRQSGEGVINTERMVVDAESAVSTVPRLAEGIELIGEYQGSGFIQAPYIVRRADGQVIQLPRLLYLLAVSVDGQRDLAAIADALTVEFGKVVLPDQVAYL